MKEYELAFIEKVIKESNIIAVVGLSPKSDRTSYEVSSFLQKQGHKIIPVYPREETILGEKVFRNLAEITDKIDTVLVFRKSDDIMVYAEEAVKIKAKYFWMPLDVVNEEAAAFLEQAGIQTVMDRCMMAETKMMIARGRGSFEKS